MTHCREIDRLFDGLTLPHRTHLRVGCPRRVPSGTPPTAVGTPPARRAGRLTYMAGDGRGKC